MTTKNCGHLLGAVLATGVNDTLMLIAGSAIVSCATTESSSMPSITVPTAILTMLPKGIVVLEATRSDTSMASGGNVTVTLESSTSAQGVGMLQ